MSEVYLPILQQLASHYRIVGITSRSAESSRKFESKTGIASFKDAAHLVEQQNPALLIVAISDAANESTIAQLLDLRVPILSETPLAWSASGVLKLIGMAAANKVTLGVAEQFPFLPLEQFRKLLIDLGIFGDVFAAFNDFHSYAYHGVAQLRRYIEGSPMSVRNVEHSLGTDIRWQNGTVKFSNGATLLHNFALGSASIQGSVHFHGTRAMMTDYHITALLEGSIETSFAVRQYGPTGSLKSISADLPAVGRITWNNPFAEYNFSDEQIAVATILRGMTKSIGELSQPIYTANDFLQDIEIVQALRYSANQGGRKISLPLKEKMEKARMLASFSFWNKRIVRQSKRLV
jgi:predicted dehydrogenase